MDLLLYLKRTIPFKCVSAEEKSVSVESDMYADPHI